MIIPAIFDRPRHISLFRVGLAIIYKGLRTFRTGIFPVLTPISHRTRHQTESGKDRGDVWTGRGKAKRRSGRSRQSGGEELTFLWDGGDTRRRVMTLIFCWESSKSRKMLKANNALFVLACSLVSGTDKYLLLVNLLNLQTSFWLIFRGWNFQNLNYRQIFLWFDL